MKKIIIFLIIVLVIIALISYAYFTYKANYNQIKQENATYEQYYDKEVYGGEVSTAINKAVDSNEKNNVQKDEKNKYIQNDENSIKIEIKITDNDTVYDMETIYDGGINRFVQFYSTTKFKCTKIEYHQSTGKVRYLYFEQV